MIEETIYVQIEAKKLRMLLSLANQSLSSSSGKGTHKCRRTIKEITDYLNNFVNGMKEQPLMFMLPIVLPEGYEFVGASNQDGEFHLHLKRKE
jgi:hypothetical protein